MTQKPKAARPKGTTGDPDPPSAHPLNGERSRTDTPPVSEEEQDASGDGTPGPAWPVWTAFLKSHS